MRPSTAGKHETLVRLYDDWEAAENVFISLYTREARRLRFVPIDFRYMTALHNREVSAARDALESAFLAWQAEFTAQGER